MSRGEREDMHAPQAANAGTTKKLPSFSSVMGPTNFTGPANPGIKGSSRTFDEKLHANNGNLHSLAWGMFYADDPRKGYLGCYGDGDGPYDTPYWGGKRTLPVSLYTWGMTHEQCAQAAALGSFDVFALQAGGHCFMGTLADVAQMKRKLEDATCAANAGWANAVFSIGACPVYCMYPAPLF